MVSSEQGSCASASSVARTILPTPGKRVQDFHVTLRRYFRLMFRGCLSLRQRRHQTIHFVIRPGELLSDDGELREDHFDVGDSGLCRAGCNGRSQAREASQARSRQ